MFVQHRTQLAKRPRTLGTVLRTRLDVVRDVPLDKTATRKVDIVKRRFPGGGERHGGRGELVDEVERLISEVSRSRLPDKV